MKIIIHSVIFQFRQNIPKDAEHHILIAPDTTTGQFFKDIGPNSYFENKEGISKTYRLSCTDGSKAAATVKNFPHPLDMTVSYTYQGEPMAIPALWQFARDGTVDQKRSLKVSPMSYCEASPPKKSRSSC